MAHYRHNSHQFQQEYEMSTYMFKENEEIKVLEFYNLLLLHV